jgi:hypothetical protein
MGIVNLLMIVDKINIARAIRLCLEAEDQAPVSRNGQAPESFQVASQRVKLPPRKAGKLAEIGGRSGRSGTL